MFFFKLKENFIVDNLLSLSGERTVYTNTAEAVKSKKTKNMVKNTLKNKVLKNKKRSFFREKCFNGNVN